MEILETDENELAVIAPLPAIPIPIEVVVGAVEAIPCAGTGEGL